MRYLLSRQATVELEDAAEEAGCPRSELMQRAGAAVAKHAQRLAKSGRIVVICGSGNNGGDGWVAAKVLHKHHLQVEVVASCGSDDLHGIAQEAAQAAIDAGVTYTCRPTDDELASRLKGAGLVVDAMLGTGFHGELREPYRTWCPIVSQCEAPVLSVDVPSGLYCDTGDSAWGAVRATATMACIAVKPGMVGGAGGELCGKVFADDLGCYELLGEDVFTLRSSGTELEPEDFKALVPLPSLDDNKYSRGKLLVVAGSSAYTGAPMMSSMAGARVGAGYVLLATPEPILPVMQQRLMSIPVRALPARGGVLDAHAAEKIVELAGKSNAVVIGPGMGRTRGVIACVQALLKNCQAPLLIDAAGLYALSGLADEAIARAEKRWPLVITPHYGELSRLALGAGIADCDELHRHASDGNLPPLKYAKLAVQVARAYGACVVAKGGAPLVTNGATTVFSDDGSAALATAGTGDVLAGIIGGLLAQKLDPVEASALGLHYGGLAGEIAAQERSAAGVIAEDVIDKLGAAILRTLDA